MKKLLSFILIAVICCYSFCGCGSKNLEDDTNSTVVISEDIKSYADTYDESYVDEDVTTNTQLWERQYYVDDFGDSTNEWFVINSEYFSGTFSNSATTNSSLAAHMIIDASSISFLLYEYESSQVKNYYSRVNGYTVKLKSENGKEYTGFGSMEGEGDRVILDGKTADKLIEYMKSGNDTKIYLSEVKGMSSYCFVVVTSNFFDLIKK